MKISRVVSGLALTAAIVSLAPVAAAQAAAGPADTADTAAASSRTWGPYYAPGHKAKALGSYVAVGEDHDVIPTADHVKLTGKVYDYTKAYGSTCGWAVFRVAQRVDGQIKLKERWYRDCDAKKPTRFTVKLRDVYQIEFKICAEPKAAKPSLNCLYAGTWKNVYLSK